MITLEDVQNNPSEQEGVEKIKIESNYLRGTLNESLIDEITGSIAPDDTQLVKFHGMYQQTDRDIDVERKKQYLEPLYSFMARVRVPGGVSTAEQWIAMDDISNKFGNETMKLTTRQAFQFHGLLKNNLKGTIQDINAALLDTIAACGDVNRNVMASPNPYQSKINKEVQELAFQIHKHLTPQTKAYHEIWLEKQLVAGGEATADAEPIYTKHYLPRKFKIAIAVPPYNDTDVFTNDVGIIAIEENGKLLGYNIAAGGGMGNAFGNEKTYPRLGTEFGFVAPSDALKVIETIVLLQRDFGNRADRKTARLKYTIDRKGVDWFKNAIETRSGISFQPSKEYKFESNHDLYGWNKTHDDKWYYGLFVENGRVLDKDDFKLKTALREIADKKISDFRLSGNQNLILGEINENDKATIDEILKKYDLRNEKYSNIRLNSIACVALNTCTMAHAEAERYLPELITKIDALIEKHKLDNEDIRIRMTGCPNGCGRPYNAEIGFVGRAPGVYNMYLGGNKLGNRLNRQYKEMLKEEDILKELDALFADFYSSRENGESFGDFTWRKGYISEKIPLNL